MYNLLVVDDEMFAADTIAKGIEWSSLGVTGVYVAYCVLDAMELFKEKQIDVMICDIEMPGNNGIQLLEWVKENYPDSEAVFLTGHANFSYAQRAVKLGSFDYLLKPADYDCLKEIVAKALEKVKKRRETNRFYETYQEYAAVWELQIPVLVERFWQDILSERLALSDTNLNRTLELYNMPLMAESCIVPILMNADQWQEPLNSKDEEIMKYAVRNKAAEIILDNLKGSVIQDHDGNNLILIYPDENIADIGKIKALCEAVIHECSSCLKCGLSCYIGDPVPIRQLVTGYYTLLEMEYSNIHQTNQVMLQRDYRITAPKICHIPSSSEWSMLLETGKKEEVLKRLEENLDELQAAGAASESLEAFYYSLLHAVYQLFHNKGLSIYDVFSTKDLTDISCHTRSMAQFKAWAMHTAAETFDFLNEKGKNNSVVVEKIKNYIQEHIYQDISREEIANYVYLNPVYISRLFKKETGIALFDYLIQMKMEQAKILLNETNMKIGDIAEKLNYYQFSHFTKMFKKFVGISPQEYRRKYHH